MGFLVLSPLLYKYLAVLKILNFYPIWDRTKSKVVETFKHHSPLYRVLTYKKRRVLGTSSESISHNNAATHTVCINWKTPTYQKLPWAVYCCNDKRDAHDDNFHLVLYFHLRMMVEELHLLMFLSKMAILFNLY